MEIIKGVEEVARENELGVVLSAQEGPGALGRSWVDAVASRRSAGLILVVSELTPQQIARLNARGIPFVVVDPAGEPAPGVPSVGATNWNGGLSATRHLLELGHTRIGMIGGPPTMLCSRARVDGYRAALETAGLSVDPDLVRWGTFHVEAGYEHGQALLELPEPPTAIFAGSDLQAFGVYEAARVAGIDIPSQLSVVGFDDLPMARWVGPPLTTIRQPLTEMAATAARFVLGQTEDPRVELATTLVVRQSTQLKGGDRDGEVGSMGGRRRGTDRRRLRGQRRRRRLLRHQIVIQRAGDDRVVAHPEQRPDEDRSGPTRSSSTRPTTRT